MLPPASDGQDAPSPRPTDDDADHPPARAESDVLSGLVRMVTDRAARLRDGAVREPRRMDALREAVDALGHYLDALELLRAAGIAIEEPRRDGAEEPVLDTGPLPIPEAGPSPGPDADAVHEPESDSASPPPIHPFPTGPRLTSDPVGGPAAAADTVEGDAPAAEGDAPAVEGDAPAVEGDAPADETSSVGVNESHEAGRRYPAFRDAATGLLSREGFEWIASGELKRCARHGRVFTVLLLQPATPGPDALERAAEALRRVLRGSDVAGREGERAVAVALPETAQREARAVGERIIAALDAADAWTRDGRIGMAGYPTHGETVWSLLETARGKLSLPVGNVLQRGSDGGYWSG